MNFYLLVDGSSAESSVSSVSEGLSDESPESSVSEGSSDESPESSVSGDPPEEPPSEVGILSGKPLAAALSVLFMTDLVLSLDDGLIFVLSTLLAAPEEKLPCNWSVLLHAVKTKLDIKIVRNRIFFMYKNLINLKQKKHTVVILA